MFLPFTDIIVSKDGDPELREMADRHYSRQSIGHPLFIGPGRKIVLRNPEGTWVFAWRKAELRKDGQAGWECTIFRNESERLSSEIILDCEKHVDGRMFTYINPRKVRSCNPGCCFKKAGWTRDGQSKGGLVRLVKYGSSCRSCARAYLRVPGGRHYNYECCGIGNAPWMKHMPDNWKCEHYEPGTYRPRVEVQTVIQGEEMEI